MSSDDSLWHKNENKLCAMTLVLLPQFTNGSFVFIFQSDMLSSSKIVILVLETWFFIERSNHKTTRFFQHLRRNFCQSFERSTTWQITSDLAAFRCQTSLTEVSIITPQCTTKNFPPTSKAHTLMLKLHIKRISRLLFFSVWKPMLSQV